MSNIDLNVGDLTGGSTDEILSHLIKHVTKSDEEIQDEREAGRPSTTELKVFVAENLGYEIGCLSEEISSLATSEKASHHAQTFIDSHNFVEEKLNEQVSIVEITTPDYERTDQFVFVNEGDYLRAITVERREWTEKTVEKLIKHLPSLNRLFISSEDLQDIVKSLDGTSLAGFTAKYRSIHTGRGFTIEFHGGTFEDLETIKNQFGAKPTRLEFTQSNSPSAVIRGSILQDGYYKQTSVLRGHEGRGRETLETIFDEYGDRDERHFAVEFTPARTPIQTGYTREGFTTLKLLGEEDIGRLDLAQRLESDVLDSKQRYSYTKWDEGNFLVFDTENNEPIEVSVESSDIALHAKDGTTASTFRDFCRIVLDEFQSTYTVEKASAKLSV